MYSLIIHSELQSDIETRKSSSDLLEFTILALPSRMMGRVLLRMDVKWNI